MRIKLLFLCFAILTTNYLLAQEKGRFGLRLGYNSSYFSSSVNSDPSSKGGLNFGAYVDFKTGNRIHFQPELNYSSQGELDNYMISPNRPSVGKTTVTLNYLNIPLIFKIDVDNVMDFQLGPQVGLLMSGREKGSLNNHTVNDDVKSVFKSDVSVVGGVGFNPGDHFNLGVRLNYGLSNIYTRPASAPSPYTSKVANRVFNFFIGWTF